MGVMTEDPNRPLPQRLSRIRELANDLWWTWHPAREVFRRLDYELWRRTAHNAVLMLNTVSQEALDRAVASPSFLALYDAAIADKRLVVVPGADHNDADLAEGPAIVSATAEFVRRIAVR